MSTKEQKSQSKMIEITTIERRNLETDQQEKVFQLK